MTSFAVVGFDPDTYEEPKPVGVEQWYDRQTRSWISYLIDENGNQVGDACFDGRRADAQASRLMLEAKLR